MANPITWRNVGQANVGAALANANAAGRQLAQGIGAIGTVADEYVQNETDARTDKYAQALMGAAGTNARAEIGKQIGAEGQRVDTNKLVKLNASLDQQEFNKSKQDRLVASDEQSRINDAYTRAMLTAGTDATKREAVRNDPQFNGASAAIMSELASANTDTLNDAATLKIRQRELGIKEAEAKAVQEEQNRNRNSFSVFTAAMQNIGNGGNVSPTKQPVSGTAQSEQALINASASGSGATAPTQNPPPINGNTSVGNSARVTPQNFDKRVVALSDNMEAGINNTVNALSQYSTALQAANNITDPKMQKTAVNRVNSGVYNTFSQNIKPLMGVVNQVLDFASTEIAGNNDSALSEYATRSISVAGQQIDRINSLIGDTAMGMGSDYAKNVAQLKKVAGIEDMEKKLDILNTTSRSRAAKLDGRKYSAAKDAKEFRTEHMKTYDNAWLRKNTEGVKFSKVQDRVNSIQKKFPSVPESVIIEAVGREFIKDTDVSFNDYGAISSKQNLLTGPDAQGVAADEYIIKRMANLISSYNTLTGQRFIPKNTLSAFNNEMQTVSKSFAAAREQDADALKGLKRASADLLHAPAP